MKLNRSQRCKLRRGKRNAVLNHTYSGLAAMFKKQLEKECNELSPEDKAYASKFRYTFGPEVAINVHDESFPG